MKSDTRSWLSGKRARGYLRVSSKGQADRYGPAAQKRDELEAATAHGTRDLETFYEDHVTATNVYKRQDFQRMVADLRAKAFDVLYVGRVDRFARDERDAWNYLYALAEAGGAVYFVEEDVLVPHDADWQDDIGTEINGAAAYIRKLRRNVTKGIRAKWAAGGHVGGLPFGYRRTADKRGLEPSDDIAVRVLCFELYASGTYSFTALAAEINRRGHRIEGHPFHVRTIHSILANPVVIGKTRWHIRRADAAERTDLVAPVISMALWESVQHLIAARRSRRGRATRQRYVFSGIARCAECGERLWGDFAQSGHQDGVARWSYRRLIHSPRGCRKGTWSEHRLEDLVGQWLGSWRLPADARTRIAQYLAQRHVDDGAAVRRKQLQGELERMSNLYRWEHIREGEYLLERGRIERAIADLPPDVRLGPPDEALALVGRIGEIWNGADEAWRRRFLDEWFDEIRIGRRASTLELVPRAPYRELVYASAQSACIPSREAEGTQAAQTRITVRGLSDWLSWWSDAEASA